MLVLKLPILLDNPGREWKKLEFIKITFIVISWCYEYAEDSFAAIFLRADISFRLLHETPEDDRLLTSALRLTWYVWNEAKLLYRPNTKPR